MTVDEDGGVATRALTARRVMSIVWPAFLVAGVAELVFFSVFDPFDLHFFGAPLEMSRQAIYTMGFFGFWGLGIASSTLTAFLEDSRCQRKSGPHDGAEDGDAEGRRAARIAIVAGKRRTRTNERGARP